MARRYRLLRRYRRRNLGSHAARPTACRWQYDRPLRRPK
ncbi:hypothetical protein YPPY10_1366, partial [Yersinia pestis PY-10]